MKINSCPFCGHTGVSLIETRCILGVCKYQVMCHWCESCGPLRRESEEAIKMWNNTSVIRDEEEL